jgi:hypothetical protein
VPIGYQSQVAKSLYGPDVSDINSTDLVGSVDDLIFYDVAVFVEPVVGVCGPGRIFLSPDEQPVFSKDTEESVPADLKVVVVKVVLKRLQEFSGTLPGQGSSAFIDQSDNGFF